jgi:hypothetical protein
VGRLFWKPCAATAPSLRYTGRQPRSVLIKNGRSWRKHLSMSVSQERSSKDTLPFTTPRRNGDGGRRVRLPKVTRSNVRAPLEAPKFDGSPCYSVHNLLGRIDGKERCPLCNPFRTCRRPPTAEVNNWSQLHDCPGIYAPHTTIYKIGIKRCRSTPDCRSVL